MTRACATIGGRAVVAVGAEALAAHYSQLDEAQADSGGVVNTLRAAIDPEGLPSFFQKLLETKTTQPTIVEAFFSTHPTDQSRVAATRAQIGALPPRNGSPLIKDSPEFQSLRSHVKTLPAAVQAPR